MSRTIPYLVLAVLLVVLGLTLKAVTPVETFGPAAEVVHELIAYATGVGVGVAFVAVLYHFGHMKD
jgi:hypothetical protein